MTYGSDPSSHEYKLVQMFISAASPRVQLRCVFLPGARTCDPKALPPAAAGAEPCLVVSWDELAVVLKKAKKGQYGCWELYADGSGPCKVRGARNPAVLGYNGTGSRSM